MLALSRPPIETLARTSLNKGRSGSRVTFFPSQKNRGPVACNNLMQADYCVHLEYRHDVLSYQCRPAALRCGDTLYKADFLVRLDSGLIVYQKFLCSEGQRGSHTREWAQAVEAMLLDGGYVFRWLTPDLLAPSLITHNLRFLYHYGFGCSRRAAKQVRAKVLALGRQGTTLKALLANDIPSQAICYAIFLDELRIDLRQKLTPQTVIYGGHDGLRSIQDR
ncbi:MULTISPECIES: hypothetical protein [unclassified Pseudomonas]|uniref:hypothetical protein n=1 Tax=unclassified Pseudomonas TaxID=196821 RepID=UPI000C8794FD|nr:MULTISPECIES: hypothetical protein [unclassified Pseudomonas]PNB71395.1 hypothetical protein C1X64_25235 [Pseudomonas sp. GW456-E7]PMU07225.1 hypothetical protein C1Y11_28420 [Pseudomonas sp. FW305-20]PMU19458.1 hypothetical protein C1Y10_09575 [Pseudomonas sp. FW305-122]PMU38573.1 hypothetical protein C1Y12_16355 [Pseudomonas sp. FW305-47B]PMX59446.1 hypothetical protein C1Y13_17835 [Pseudomonas sp. FW305-33]